MSYASIFIFGLALVTDFGSFSNEQARNISDAFVRNIGLESNSRVMIRKLGSSGTFDFQYNGIGSVGVNSWSGRVVRFDNSKRYCENYKGLRKGLPRRIDSISQATVAGLEWAKKLKIPRSALHPCGIRFTPRPSVIVGFEELLNGYRFLQGMPYLATIKIDVTDKTLMKYHEFPPGE